MANDPYKFQTRTNGEVVIFHNGKLAKMLKDAPAKEFLKAVKAGDPQEVMAAASGDDHAARPTAGTGSSGKSVHGDGAAHGHKEFRRKSGG